MPHKFNAARRHKFDKAQYRVINWAEYNESLRKRGGQRSRIETQIGRWKSVVGPRLRSRSFSRQITEIQLGQKVLKTMTALGRPVFERIA